MEHVVQMGRRVRVTHLKDVIATDDDALNAAAAAARVAGRTSFPTPKKIVARAGDTYEGVVTELHEGWFDLQMDDGEAMGFYAHDPALRIEAAA